MSLEAMLGPELLAAVHARTPFVGAPRPDVVSAVPVEAAAWLGALTPILAADRMTPRAHVQRRERAVGPVLHEELVATDYIAIVGAGRERWTLHGARDDLHDVEAGSVLFVPAGVGVSVETRAFARLWYLTFTFPSWVDIVANTAMLELGAAPSWREPGPLAADQAVAAALAALRALRLP